VTSALSLRLNALGLLALTLVLALAFADQLLFGDLPCPLCLLQRAGFVAAALGLVLNLTCGVRPSHYGLMILGAVFGGLISLRQGALHVVPGSGSYGSAFLELHFYTWALVVFTLIVAGSAIMLLFDRQFAPAAAPGSTRRPLLAPLALAAFAAVVALNALSTLAECGVGLCPDNPTTYELLQGAKLGAGPVK